MTARAATYGNVLRKVDAEQVNALLTQTLTRVRASERCGDAPSRLVGHADCRDWRTARTVNKGHGRLEIREIVVSTELNEFLAGKWTGVAQVFRLTRTVTEDGQTRSEVVYGLSSLSPIQAPAARLLELV